MTHRSAAPTTTSSYRSYNNEDYAPVQRSRVDKHLHQEVEVERTKKDKKWSLGKLFRRKKKEDESVSSSESDEGISTRSPSKRKLKKKKKNAAGNFDHIVMRETRRAQSLIKQSNRDFADEGVLSDPSAGFITYRSKITHEPHRVSKESLNFREENGIKCARLNTDVIPRKSRKGRLKARVEALRNSMRGESSSDEGSIKSSNSSSMVRFRSDESLMRSRESSINKRSRSARNERYIKRLSRDEENQLNKEAELLQQGYTKAEVEMLTRTPTSQSSGYGTCKREQATKQNPEQLLLNDLNRHPMKSESISSFPSTHSYPSSINFNAKVNGDHINYSIQYPNNNVNKEPTYANNNRERRLFDQYNNTNNVMCVKFPLGNVTNIKKDERAPPVPPPRDLQRKVTTPLSMYYDNNSIVADRAVNNRNVHGVTNNDFERVIRRSQERTLHPVVNGLRRPISTSEDHIAMQNNDYLKSFRMNKGEQQRRPASVSAEPNHYSLYSNTPPWRTEAHHASVVKPEPVQPRNDYMYYADQSPRSRRPISIQSSQNAPETQYLSDSQASLKMNESFYRRPRNNASEFWKKLDDAERQRRQQTVYASVRSTSEGPNLQKYGHVTNQDFENKNKLTLHTQPRDTTDGGKLWKATTEYKRSITVEPPKSVTSPTSKTHVRHKSDTFISNNYQITSDDEKSTERRKSTNLDDALNELEAIYNSLGLGDEDLLDRAERRELMTPKLNEHFNDWNGNDEIQLRSQPTTPLRRIQRRSTLPDKLQDDMAFRRLNSKEKPALKDNQTHISYMLASPVYVPYTSDDDKHSEHEKNEPDIVYDDVMYRNIKQANSRLKTFDPQPFGIPVGPVSPAPQSDYLHATPDNRPRPRFVPRRSPDLVSDDLAYRSLRKDNRHSSVFNEEEYNGHVNNNHSTNDYTKESPTNIKKKRAVRSLSANIFTMIQQEIDDALNMSKMATLQKTQSNGDVNKRLRDSIGNNDFGMDHYPRNKVKQRHNTVSIFVNNTHSPTHHFAKDDSYIHNDNQYLPKPPSCDKSKSSSPSTRSPQTSKRSSRDEFQQVLSMLAQEAMDTSNKLGVALAELDKNKNNTDKKSDIYTKLSDSRMNFLNGLTNKNNENTEVKHVNIHSENVINTMPALEKSSIKNNFKAKKTEDSLLAISDQLHKVEDKLKHSFEKEIMFQDESLKLSDHISKTDVNIKAQETTIILPEHKIIPDVVPVKIQNDVVKINNLKISDNNIERPSPCNEISKMSIDDRNIHSINETNAFKELKEGISDLIAGISHVNDKLFTNNKSKTNSNEMNEVSGITEADAKLSQVTEKLQNEKKKEPTNRASVNLSIYEDDLELRKDVTDSTEYNSSEELATIFNLNSASRKCSAVYDANKEKADGVRNDLNSPKLVQSVNQQLRRLSVDNEDDNVPSQSNSNVVPWRTKRQTPSSQNDNTGM